VECGFLSEEARAQSGGSRTERDEKEVKSLLIGSIPLDPTSGRQWAVQGVQMPRWGSRA
jgi:hypothetical protein